MIHLSFYYIVGSSPLNLGTYNWCLIIMVFIWPQEEQREVTNIPQWYHTDSDIKRFPLFLLPGSICCPAMQEALSKILAVFVWSSLHNGSSVIQ